jgi:hypothetical protein
MGLLGYDLAVRSVGLIAADVILDQIRNINNS